MVKATSEQWFAVNPEGLRKQQQEAGLAPAVRELVQNAFDATNSSETVLNIHRHAKAGLIITCTDNGAGFEKLEDAWTLFNPSNKGDNPELRGRFCVGEKFAVAQAKCASVKTRTGEVTFRIDGTREVSRHRKFNGGTRVTLELGKVSTKDEVEAIAAAQMIQPPANHTYTVNGTPV